MQHVVTDEVIRRALRARICPTCPHRPDGSEAMDPLEARASEPACTIFANLEALKSIAAKGAGDIHAGFERAIKDGICQHCTATPTAGDWCYERFARSCPLSIFAADVVEIIESLLKPTARLAVSK